MTADEANLIVDVRMELNELSVFMKADAAILTFQLAAEIASRHPEWLTSFARIFRSNIARDGDMDFVDEFVQRHPIPQRKAGRD